MRGNKEKITNELIRKAKSTVKKVEPDEELNLLGSGARGDHFGELIGIYLSCCQERLSMRGGKGNRMNSRTRIMTRLFLSMQESISS
jgi:hypothetical protein